LTDVSSEMIFPILPLFLSDVIQAPMSAIGLIEGMAESTASILKLLSGWVSDKIGKRKPIIFLGYLASTISKPFFALSTTWWHVLVVRFTERVGKGLRTAPRDALIAESVTSKTRGRAFGLHRTLDTAGAILGPILAFILLNFFLTGDLSQQYRSLFWISAIPAALAVICILLFVKEIKPAKEKIRKIAVSTLSRNYKVLLLAVGLFSLANFSYAFFILRAQDVGVALAVIPLIYLFYNIVYAATAYPAGRLSDIVGRKPAVFFAYLLFADVCLGFAIAPPGAIWQMWLMFALYGVFMAFFDTVQRAYVSDLVSSEKRATALGAYHGVVGLGALPAGVVSGSLWQLFGPFAAFSFGLGVALVAAAILLVFVREK